jgi:hypothetical protein
MGKPGLRKQVSRVKHSLFQKQRLLTMTVGFASSPKGLLGYHGAPSTMSQEPAMNFKTLACLSLIVFVALCCPAANAQTFSVIHTFNWSDGSTPFAGVTLRGGTLYGTTNNGGTVNTLAVPYTRSGS